MFQPQNNRFVAAARAGGEVANVACLGNDEFGTVLRAGLTAEDVHTDGIVDVEGTFGTAITTPRTQLSLRAEQIPSWTRR